MSRSRVERFARELSPLRIASVRYATKNLTAVRRNSLQTALGDDWERARDLAAEVKDAVLTNLRGHLLELEAACQSRGIHVHWASDAESARRQIVDIVRSSAARGETVVKAKSMATEEIHLNGALEMAGFEVVETDLGEFVVQIEGETPSHIVAPIIHKSRLEVADAFAREGLGPYTEEPTDLTMQARTFLRSRFQRAKVGISGVNFAVAETGRLVIVENEGNNRLSTTAPDVHIAVMGIEKILPREAYLPMFLKLLACSALNIRMTTYVHFISGPRRADEVDGPEEVHLVLLDHGRSKVARGPFRRILRCLRCGACQNACPVYRQSTGHAYGHVYSGPIGAVLAPALEGIERHGELSKASSLCGLCEEVCPVKIPIPEMLLRLRDEYVRQGGDPGAPWALFEKAATNPMRWKTALAAIDAMGPFAGLLRGWTEFRETPVKVGRDFRKWWRER